MSHEIWPFWGVREPVSAATHCAACIWSIYASLFLWRLCRGDRARQWAVSCFGVSMIVLYAASAIYHTVRCPPGPLHYFRLFDQTAIFGLIAGTYTPVFHVLLRDSARKRFLIRGIWVLAALGVAAKWLLPREPYWLTVFLYLSLAYSGMLCIKDLWQTTGMRGMLWVAWGGVFYTVGALADLVEWPIVYPGVFGYHEFFHVCTMAGTSCHYVFILLFVLPYAAPAKELGLLPGTTAAGAGLALAEARVR
jgi:hemolysin III